MKTRDYASEISQPNAKRRSVLEETIRLIEPHDRVLAATLRNILAQPPITKPLQHRGGPETDWFHLTITREESIRVTDILFTLEAAAVPQDGDFRSPEADRLAALVDEWNRLSWEDPNFPKD